MGRKWLLQLAAVYYISMFLFLRNYYNAIEDEGISVDKRNVVIEMNAKVDNLSKLSDGLTRNLLDLHKKLSHLNSSENEMGKRLNNTKTKDGKTTTNVTKNSIYVNGLSSNIKGLTRDKIKPEDRIVYVFPNGDVTVNKTVLFNHLKNSLRKWDFENEAIAFMHIGKNGGTSFRGGLMKASQDNGCKLKETSNIAKQETHKCPGTVRCVCKGHYDWTVFDKLESKGVKVAPLALLRNPTKRSISHFYFAQTLPWTKGAMIRQQNLSQYLKDPQSMLDTRDVWQDGQVNVLKNNLSIKFSVIILKPLKYFMTDQLHNMDELDNR